MSNDLGFLSSFSRFICILSLTFIRFNFFCNIYPFWFRCLWGSWLLSLRHWWEFFSSPLIVSVVFLIINFVLVVIVLLFFFLSYEVTCRRSDASLSHGSGNPWRFIPRSSLIHKSLGSSLTVVLRSGSRRWSAWLGHVRSGLHILWLRHRDWVVSWRFRVSRFVENVLLMQNCVTKLVLNDTGAQISFNSILNERHFQNFIDSWAAWGCDSQTFSD
jgi:hypothetical protein